MRFLLFFVTFIFWVIFYLLHSANIGWNFLWFKFEKYLLLESISWNILIESITFFVISIFFFIGFSSYEFRKKETNKSINIEEIKRIIEVFFKKYLYYIWFVLSYASIFFILKSFNFTDISVFILIINLTVLVLFLLTNKFFIFRDYIKVNTILFSLYYIFYYLYYLFLDILIVSPIDFLNSIFVFLFFILNFYNDKKVLSYHKSDTSMVFYFFSYVFIFITYYLATAIWDISFTITVFWTLLSLFMYFFVSKISFFKNNIILIRIISFIFLYIATFVWTIYTIKNGLNLIFLSVLVYSIVFNFKIHERFQNYISFFFSIFTWIFIVFYFYFKKLYGFDDGFIFLVLSLGISLELVIITYFYKFKYMYDNHFIHVIWYFVNIIALFYYFIEFEFDFFVMWIILLIESIFVFLSYYKLRKIWKTNLNKN